MDILNVILLLTVALGILFILKNAQVGLLLTLIGTIGLISHTRRENYSLQDCSAYPFDFKKE